MTAEVAVMNRLGVALAADSAVTLSGRHGRKIYSSVDKLFQLTEQAPVGLMVYGNADFVNVPWETIVKTYRKDRSDNPAFHTLFEYVDDFLKFLEHHPKLFPDVAQEAVVRSLVQEICYGVKNHFVKEVEKELTKNGESELNAEELQELFAHTVETLQ